MGMLVQGRWQNQDLSGFKRDGETVRFGGGFQNWISTDGTTKFTPNSERYSLYCNRTCPWSHRTLIVRELKGLSQVIDIVLLEPAMGVESWWFGKSGQYRDPELGATHLHQLYSHGNPEFTGRVTIPVLWDRWSKTIVNNDSGMIARILNSEFNFIAVNPEVDFYPASCQLEIDKLNDFVGDRLNDGVYRCLLAKSKVDYQVAFDRLFDALDTLEQRLATRRYLLGAYPTEPDWRLFSCLVRFDCVYYPLYKCNRKRIVDYTNLWGYARDLYQIPTVANTIDFDGIKEGYYDSVSHGVRASEEPVPDFGAPHDRHEISKSS